MCPQQACFQKLQTAVATAASVCAATPAAHTRSWQFYDERADLLAELQQFQSLNTYLTVACLTDSNGNYCLPQFFTSAFQLQNNELSVFNGFSPLNLLHTGRSVASNAVLASICSTCALKIATTYQSLNPSFGYRTYAQYAASLNAACIIDPTAAASTPAQYCLNSLTAPTTVAPTTASPTTAPVLANSTASVATTAGTDTAPANTWTNDADTNFAAHINPNVCTACYRLVYNAVNQASLFANTVGGAIVNNANNNILDAVCAVNNATGQRCAATVLALQNSFVDQVYSTCYGSIRGSQCSTRCAKLLTQLAAADGCCLGTFITAFKDSIPQFLGTVGSSSSTATTAATTSAITALFNKCNVSTAALQVCPGAQQPTQTDVAIVNLNYTTYLNNITAVTATLQQDIAAAAGVSANSVTILLVRPRGQGGIRVVAAISAATQADVTPAGIAVNTTANTTGIALVQTAVFFASSPSSLNAPAQAIVATSTLAADTTISTTTTTTGAAMATSSFSPLLLLFSALLAYIASIL